jgi:integrase
LRAALSDAVNDEIIPRNAATLVEPPTGTARPAQPLTPSEATRILAVAKTDRLRALWLVLLALGLRRGEALALR